jgi:hypothetical protein
VRTTGRMRVSWCGRMNLLDQIGTTQFGYSIFLSPVDANFPQIGRGRRDHCFFCDLLLTRKALAFPIRRSSGNIGIVPLKWIKPSRMGIFWMSAA